jgi:hypothetical protein
MPVAAQHEHAGRDCVVERRAHSGAWVGDVLGAVQFERDGFDGRGLEADGCGSPRRAVPSGR